MKLIEIKDISKYAPFKRTFLYYLFNHGKLKKHEEIKEIKVVTKRIYFDLDELNAFLETYDPKGKKKKDEQNTRSNNKRS